MKKGSFSRSDPDGGDSCTIRAENGTDSGL